MKTLLLCALSACLYLSVSQAQTWRYFEFTTQCGHGAWQDTSFIAATSNPELIDTVLANLGRPIENRKFISGTIEAGNSGYNHNANHWFLWHFNPNQWNLAELAIEVCDGCPYSDVDADTAYWLQTLGQFCPWSGRPAREISQPISIQPYSMNPSGLVLQQQGKDLKMTLPDTDWYKWTIYDLQGKRLKTGKTNSPLLLLSLPELENGYYLFELYNAKNQGFRQRFGLTSN